MLALAYCSAVVDIAFDIDNSWYFVQVPVDWVHCKAEHEDGKCAGSAQHALFMSAVATVSWYMKCSHGN